MGQETFLRVGIDGTGAESGSRVVKRSLDDIAAGASTADNAVDALQKSLLAIGGAAFGIYSLYTGLQAIGNYAKESLEYLAHIETSTLGIAAAFLVGGKYIDETTGKALEGQAALTAAQAESAQVIEQLKVANMQTIATLDQLIVAYQVTLPVAMAKGFNKQQVMDFTLAMVQAAGAIGLPFNQMAEETRSLLTGAIVDKNSRIATVLGIRPEDIHGMKGNSQELFDFLMNRLQGFQIAGEASQKTWAGMWSNLKDWMSQISGLAFQPMFDEIKVTIGEIMSTLGTFDKGGIHFAPWVTETISAVHLLADAVVHATNVGLAWLLVFKGIPAAQSAIYMLTEAYRKHIATEIELQTAEEAGNAVRLGGIEQQRAMAVAKAEAAGAALQLAEANMAGMEAQVAESVATQDAILLDVYAAQTRMALAQANFEAAASTQSLANARVEEAVQSQELQLAYIREIESRQLVVAATKEQQIAELQKMQVEVEHHRGIVANLAMLEECRMREASISYDLQQTMIQEVAVTEELSLAKKRLAMAGNEEVAAQEALYFSSMNLVAANEEVVISTKNAEITENQYQLAMNRTSGVMEASAVARTELATAQSALNTSVEAGIALEGKAATTLLSFGTVFQGLFALFMGYQFGTFLYDQFELVRKASVEVVWDSIRIFNELVFAIQAVAAVLMHPIDSVTGNNVALAQIAEERNKWLEFWKKGKEESFAEAGTPVKKAGTVLPYQPNDPKKELDTAVEKAHADHIKAMFDMEKAQNENEMKLNDERIKGELQANQYGYDSGLKSLREFYDEKIKLEDQVSANAVKKAYADVQSAQQAIDALASSNISDPKQKLKNESDIEKAKITLTKAEGAYQVAVVASGNAHNKYVHEAESGMDKLKDTFKDYEITRLEGEGRIVEALEKRIAKEKDSDAYKQLVANSGTPEGAAALSNKNAILDAQTAATLQKSVDATIAIRDANIDIYKSKLVAFGYTQDEANSMMEMQVRDSEIAKLENEIATTINVEQRAGLQYKLDSALELRDLREGELKDERTLQALKREQTLLTKALQIAEASGAQGLVDQKEHLQDIIVDTAHLLFLDEMRQAMKVATKNDDLEQISLIQNMIDQEGQLYIARHQNLDAQNAIRQALGLSLITEQSTTKELQKQVDLKKQMATSSGSGIYSTGITFTDVYGNAMQNRDIYGNPILPSHATGIDWVPEDGPRYLHKGERVVTAAQNMSADNYSGGGSKVVQFTGPITIVTQASDPDAIARDTVKHIVNYMGRSL